MSGADIKGTQSKEMLKKENMQGCAMRGISPHYIDSKQKKGTQMIRTSMITSRTGNKRRRTPSAKTFHCNSTYAGSDVVNMCVLFL